MLSGPERKERPSAVPDWLPWLQLGITTMLAVLFLVMLAKGREQNHRLRELEQQVQGLENSRALDRTPAMEQQLRSMLQRLQKLEAQGVRLEAMVGRQEQLERELLELRSRAAPLPLPPAASEATRPSPSAPSAPRRSPPPVRAPETTVIRPPASGKF
jgi:TolA-binding protein